MSVTNEIIFIMDYLKEYPLKELNESFKKICRKHCKIKHLPSDTFDGYTIDNYPAILETREDIKELRKIKENIEMELNYIYCFLSYVIIYDSINISKYLPTEDFKSIVNKIERQKNNSIKQFDLNKWKKEHKLLNKYLAIRNVLKGVY